MKCTCIAFVFKEILIISNLMYGHIVLILKFIKYESANEMWKMKSKTFVIINQLMLTRDIKI